MSERHAPFTEDDLGPDDADAVVPRRPLLPVSSRHRPPSPLDLGRHDFLTFALEEVGGADRGTMRGRVGGGGGSGSVGRGMGVHVGRVVSSLPAEKHQTPSSAVG